MLWKYSVSFRPAGGKLFPESAICNISKFTSGVSVFHPAC